MRNSIFDQLIAHPSWVAGAVTVGTAIVFFRLIRREHRRLRAKERYESLQCVNCGYDLRASDDRCPECGFPIRAPDLPLTMRLNLSAMRNDWPSTPREARKPLADEGRVEVYTAEAYASDEIMSVDALASQLEARGIATSVSASHIKTLDPITMMTNEHWGKKISVWSGDVKRATEIIQGFGEISVARRLKDAASPRDKTSRTATES
ncbi:MAG: hypothetical protein ABSH08_16170 [Tepidisphaeraceae bacterium]|jgi:hypothetical protein